MTELSFQRRVLDNGLTLLFHANSSVPLLSLCTFFLAGKDQNPMDSPGLSSLTARLLDEGTEHYEEEQISQTLEGIGAELTTFGERELSGACLSLQSGDLQIGIELLADMLRRPTFPPERIELERHQITNHIQAMSDDPQVVGSQLLNEWVYSGTPLAKPVLGTMESITRLTREQVVEFHRRRLGPGNCVLVAVGDVDFGDLLDAVVSHLGDWHNADFELVRLEELQRQRTPIYDHRPMDKEQVNIYLGHLGVTRTNPDFYALQVMDTILGGGPGFTSRIPRKIRDEQGLAYLTYADLTGSSGVYPGRFVAFVGTAPENAQLALDSLKREIALFLEDGPDQDELETAQEFLTGSFVFELQSNASVARLLLSIEVFSLGRSFLVRYPDLVRAVTLNDVRRVAARYLDTINYTTVIVGSL
jgi:zinc protease